MSQQKEKFSDNDESMPAADTGNASNPSPNKKNENSTSGNQLLDEKAEKYLRESGNIEDVPDAQDQQEMDKTLREEKASKQ